MGELRTLEILSCVEQGRGPRKDGPGEWVRYGVQARDPQTGQTVPDLIAWSQLPLGQYLCDVTAGKPYNGQVNYSVKPAEGSTAGSTPTTPTTNGSDLVALEQKVQWCIDQIHKLSPGITPSVPGTTDVPVDDTVPF